MDGKKIVTKCVTWGRSGNGFNKYGPSDHKAITCWLLHGNKQNKSRFFIACNFAKRQLGVKPNCNGTFYVTGL